MHVILRSPVGAASWHGGVDGLEPVDVGGEVKIGHPEPNSSDGVFRGQEQVINLPNERACAQVCNIGQWRCSGQSEAQKYMQGLHNNVRVMYAAKSLAH